MKKMIAAWFRFSRAERIGISCFAVLLLSLVFIRLGMQRRKMPATENQVAGRKLQAGYDQLLKQKQNLPASETALLPAPEALFYFDPNTLDSAGFIRLGMPVPAVRGLMNWRRKGKHFFKPEDLKPLYNLPEASYVRLAPYIRIASPERYTAFNNQDANSAPRVLDLNAADSAHLERYVPGIGPVLAHKIVERRKALGGFQSLEQLLEVYKFPDTTFQKMKKMLRIYPESIPKMDLNIATEKQLAAHPYIGETLAKYLLLYREGIGGYVQIEQLRQAPLMNEEIYRKIAPYLTVGPGPLKRSGRVPGAGPDTE